MKALQKLHEEFASIGRLTIMLRYFWSAFDMKDSTNGKKPIITPRIQRLDLGVRKP
jgi:hypothetical protein